MRKSLLPIVIFISVFVVSCNNKNKAKVSEEKAEVIKLKPALELVWETDSLLTTCEAVLYDKSSQTIYVSNINNSPWEKDGNGFISTISLKGDITNLKWIEGLSAPKGLGISNGKLYVNDIDDLVEIDIVSQKIINKYTVENNPQLNDITVDADGIVYASGSNSNTIYQIKDDILSVFAADSLKRLNGLLHTKEGIYYLDSGTHQFGIYDIASKTFKKLTEDIGHGDGIYQLENGDFITSSWKGELFYIHSSDWSKTPLLDTREQAINAADIDFIPETQTLLVPTFFHNKVMAYKLKFE
ncbi:hypothetical protein [Seonamhaeicola sp.]|uniref:hypothetical protein n=1 Tax=Seonamhaeicola sp. TaxID=1912245 RepID=UPI00261FC49B|nr:hypothetical protein [Seonamhaeicola sp.]